MSIPGSASPLLFASVAAEAAAYQIDRSLRFNSSDSAYLSRTPSSAGNRKTWTWSGWVKRSAIASGYLFSAGSSVNDSTLILLNGNHQLSLHNYSGGSFVTRLETSAVLRDASAWYHIVVTFDSTNATSSDRAKIYINGSRVTNFSTSTYPSLNTQAQANNSVIHYFSRSPLGSYFNGYLADIHFIDGQALDPTDFGEYDDNNVWQPKEYAGTYGTNGFHLDFSDNSTAAALGTDTSGNSNTWTVNNISVAAGAGNDSLVDSPTNGDQTDTGAGGEVVGNYCTLNPLANGGTVSNGNLDATSGTNKVIYSTFALDSGKYYWEITLNGSNLQQIGIADFTKTNTTNSAPGDSGRNGYIYLTNGSTYNNGTLLSSSYDSSTTGDVIGIAYDGSSNKLWLRKNSGSWFGGGDPATGTTPTMTTSTSFIYTPVLGAGGGTDAVNASCNWGQRSWAYSAPSGYKALCTTNLPDPTIADGSTAMDVKLYTGNGSTQTISGLNFSPDLVWLKNRASASYGHRLVDQVRGNTKYLMSHNTGAEATDSNGITAFNSDGFDLGSSGDFNVNNNAFVAWTWDAGSSTVSNTDGSITSNVRANASAGFSIVTYTGSGSLATIGHGLNAAPELIIVKSRTNTENWAVYSKAAGAANRLILNLTVSAASGNEYWNSTDPTSSVFTVNTVGQANGSGQNYVAYCFAPVDGYSSFGSYTGNGSTDGPFVFTGFRPRFILLKTTTRSGDQWIIQDTSRDRSNVADTYLFPNSSNAEGTASGGIDILSNGFKLRDTTGSYNASGDTYIAAAFAEHPFKTARAR